MTLSRAAFAQVRRMLRPLETKVANIAARAVIKLIVDSGTRQIAQVGGLDSETLDDVQHFIPYGLISVPRDGAEGVMLFVDGDRGHPLLFAVDDRSARPTGGDPGDTGLYHFDGAQVRLTSGGDIEIKCKPGQKVVVNDGSGGQTLATQKDIDNLRNWVFAQFSNTAGHVHVVVGGATTTMVTVPATPVPPAPTPSVPPTSIGTIVLEAK